MRPSRLVPRALRELTVTYSKADLLAVGLVATVASGWVAVAGGAASVLAFVLLQAMFFVFYLVGSLLAAWTGLAAGVLFDLPLRLLVGYVVVNTLLLALAPLSPLGMVGNFGIVVALAALVFFVAKERRAGPGVPAGLWAIAFGLVAATFWCQDCLDPIVERGETVSFKPWVDSFYHAVHIRIFAESHGAETIEDFRLAGVPARLYHYGVYMMPAVIKAASGIHSYTAFAGILAPLGVLFTALAAYAFLGSLWGPWPGFAAAAALLVLPDGAQQGVQNPFLSYHWLTQISPSATYGLAVLAVAWLFVVRGCTSGSRLQVIVGWFVAGVVALYKLHYSIASAPLLLLIPALFFGTSLRPAQRALLAVAAGLVCAGAFALVQRVPGVPPIRLDASSLDEILHLVHSFQVPGGLRDFLAERIGRDVSWSVNLLFGAPYVLAAVFGASLPLLLVLLVRLRREPLLYVLFPALLLANFLVMFFGLALDFGRSTPEELSHRPLMIVYFFTTSWVGAGFGLVILRSNRFRSAAPALIVGLAVLLLSVPANLGSGVQLMWVMPQVSPVRLPVGLVRAAEHMREHGSPDDLFQDSQFDRTYAIAALSELRPFVAHTMTRMPHRAEMVTTRSAAVDRLMSLTQPKLVAGTARAYGIRWFVLHQGNKVRWPPELAGASVFRRGPIALYEF